MHQCLRQPQAGLIFFPQPYKIGNWRLLLQTAFKATILGKREVLLAKEWSKAGPYTVKSFHFYML